MSLSISPAGAGAARAAAGLRFDGVALCTALVFPLALLLCWPRVAEIWSTGAFHDTDDAMRMVQVRDWMAGQGWFDLHAHRLDPPAGVLMHWSRVVDVPLAALVRLFGLFADPVHAERLARIVFPVALQGAMIAATAWTARALAGPNAVMPAAFLVLLSGIGFEQFQPGRVDHHAPQILLLMLSTGTALRGLDPRTGRFAALSGVLVAASLAISLENLPFFAVLLAAPPLAWALRGEPQRRGLAWAAAGLLVAAPAFFLATVPPWRYGAATADAFSAPHLAGLMAGAAGLAGLAALSPRLRGAPSRVLAAMAVGVLALGAVALAGPVCLGGPYADMDPLIARLWLGNVTEAQPVLRLARLHPDVFTTLVCPILIGAAATLAGLWHHRRTAPRPWGFLPWGLLAALVAVGLAGTVWQIRVACSVAPLALLGGAWAVGAVLGLAQARGRLAYALLPFALVCALSSLVWTFVPVAGPAPAEPGHDADACRTDGALATLAGLAPVSTFAPVDAGAHLLAYTKVSVLAGPYHRDQHGIRLVLDGFLAPPDRARAIVQGAGVKLLVLCPADPLVGIMAREAPGGLAADLLAGRTPPWLIPLDLGASPYRAFTVAAPAVAAPAGAAP